MEGYSVMHSVLLLFIAYQQTHSLYLQITISCITYANFNVLRRTVTAALIGFAW
jgi:hypothetical protein